MRGLALAGIVASERWPGTRADYETLPLYSLWVTPYSEDEKYPGGDYPLQNVKTGGVAEWVKQVGYLQIPRTASRRILYRR